MFCFLISCYNIGRSMIVIWNRKIIRFDISIVPASGSETGGFSTNSTNDYSKTSHVQALCTGLQGRGLSASALWYQHLDQIANAMIHPSDTNKTHSTWIKKLIRFLSPSLMRQASKGLQELKESTLLFEKLGAHYNREGRHASKKPSPIKIMIFGGSVIEGSGCSFIPPELGIQTSVLTAIEKLSPRQCSFPFRLQSFLNNLLGEGVVEVKNLAVGGTSSVHAVPIIKHKLSDAFWPTAPDILIHAYFTNDHLPMWSHLRENTTSDYTHQRRALEQNESFLSTVLAMTDCEDPPLVYYVNEYIGSQQQSILGDGFMDEAAYTMLAQGSPRLGYVSSANGLRRFALGNTRERVFSGPLTKDKLLNVHFGQSGHVSVALILAYLALEATVSFCEAKGSMETYTENLYYKDDSWHGNTVITHNSAPAISVAPQTSACGPTDKKAHQRLCEFAFLAAPLGTHHKDVRLNRYLTHFMDITQGWEAENDYRHGGYQNKSKYCFEGLNQRLSFPNTNFFNFWLCTLSVGIVAKANAQATLMLNNLSMPVATFGMSYLKSYGKKWENSTATFRLRFFAGVSGNGQLLYDHSFHLYGFHNQSVSISYRQDLTFFEHPAPVGGSVWLTMELVRGSSFKINSMTFCRQ